MLKYSKKFNICWLIFTISCFNPLFGPPDLSFFDRLSSIVRLSVCLSVNFSHFHPLQKHQANFNQTWHKAFLRERDSNLFKSRATTFLKVHVCHSSTFQTMSVRSVYIKIINYSGSILAKLNNTMKKKTKKKPRTCNEKTALLFKQKQYIQGITFCVERIFRSKSLKSSIFVNLTSWNCV